MVEVWVVRRRVRARRLCQSHKLSHAHFGGGARLSVARCHAHKHRSVVLVRDSTPLCLFCTALPSVHFLSLSSPILHHHHDHHPLSPLSLSCSAPSTWCTSMFRCRFFIKQICNNIRLVVIRLRVTNKRETTTQSFMGRERTHVIPSRAMSLHRAQLPVLPCARLCISLNQRKFRSFRFDSLSIIVISGTSPFKTFTLHTRAIRSIAPCTRAQSLQTVSRRCLATSRKWTPKLGKL